MVESHTDTDFRMSTQSNPSLAKKPTKVYSCALCTRRKVKCDRTFPCSYCVRCGVTCTQAEIAPPKPRKRRFAEAELLARLKRYEGVLKELGQDLGKINAGAAPMASTSGSVVKSSPTSTPAADTDAGDSDPEPQWSSAQDYRNKEPSYLGGSESDDMGETPIASTWNVMYRDDGSSLLFGPGSPDVDLISLHPRPEHGFILWQNFLERVNPLVKIIHVPTLQPLILSASFNLPSTEPAMHALMFGIYSMAANSQDESTCLDLYGQDKTSLINRFQIGSQYALRQAEFLRSDDIMVLQALVLHLTSLRPQVDPRSLFCFTGIADRIARRSGLHRAGRTKGMTIFESEMRKRLWWQIVALEVRLAEMSGAGPSILSPLWDAKLPLNVNDSDLEPEMTLEPREHRASTEMIFCLPIYEAAEYMRNIRLQNDPSINSHELNSPRAASANAKRSVDELEQRINDKYVKYCDPQLPLHAMAVAAVRFSVYKLRASLHSTGQALGNASLAINQERSSLFELNVSLLEDANRVQANPGLLRFGWYLYFKVPYLPCIQIALNLRLRPIGALSDRAWTALETCMDAFSANIVTFHNKRALLDSPLHLGMVSLIVKAWETREQAIRQETRSSPPIFITEMRAKLAAKRGVAADSATAPPGQSGDGLDGFSRGLSSEDLNQLFPGDSLAGNGPGDFWNTFMPGELMMQNFNWSQLDDLMTQ